MKIIVTGATGLVGAEVLRLAINDDNIEQVTALTRRPSIIQHPKIRTVVHKDFLDYSGLEDLFKEHDAILWCLGISVSQVNKQQYHVITYDYAVNAAKDVLQYNPQMRFVFLSGDGADSTEKSRLLFERIKGKTENALMKMPFNSLFIARPGGIKPINKNPNAPLMYKLFMWIYPLMEFFTPHKVISSIEVAKALLYIAKYGTDEIIVENIKLKKLATL